MFRKRKKINISLLFRMFVKIVMRCGKLLLAITIVQNVLKIFKKRFRIKNPILFLYYSLQKYVPRVRFVKKKVAGRIVMIPVFLAELSSLAQGFRVLVRIATSKKNSNKSLSFKMAILLVMAYCRRGSLIKWRKSFHKQASDSRANLRFLRFKRKAKA